MIRSIVIVILFLFQWHITTTLAQNFGGNPSSTKWRQVNTAYAKVIFPRGLDSAANRVATITAALMQQDAGNIGKEHRKVTVVLQADNTVSNAYVQLAPYRSEFYLTTPQNPFELGSLQWVDNLAVHEWRHVEQNSNFNHGLSKAFSILLGEQGQAFANALAVPDWFYEGDAVWNETAFSRQGRGRLPNNFSPYKSLLFANYNYSYMKLRNGSYKSYVPNHYDLGYLLVTYGREKYGDSIWRKVTADAVRFRGLFYPWQKAVKKNTQVDFNQFKNDALHYFRQQWNNERDFGVEWITANERNNVVSYLYPYPADDQTVIILKQSYRQIPVFVTKDLKSGEEKKISVKDIGYEDYFSYRNGNIVYTALKPDARWGNRDYSVIRLLNVKSRKTISISKKGKYFSPDINDKGNLIAVVEANPSMPAKIQLLDLKGNVLKSYNGVNPYYYSHPKFINDTTVVVAARTKQGHMGWMVWNTISDTVTWLLSPQDQMIGFPVIKNDTLFYSGTAGNLDALFAINLKEKNKPVMLANYPTGVYQGFENKGKVLGSVFTASGNRLAYLPFADKIVKNQSLQPLYAASGFSDKPNLTALPTNIYPSEKYSKAYKLFNFHSWQPDISEKEYGVSLLGENVLSTLYSRLFYVWNQNENSHKVGAEFTYGGWYVQPFTSVSQTWNREIALNADTTFMYNESNATAGVQLPLNLSFGKTYSYLNLSASISNQNVKWTGVAKDLLKNTSFNYITSTVSHTAQIQKALQQIYPRLAESITLTYNRAVTDLSAWQYLFNGYFYLPGFFNTHNIVLSFAWQARDTLKQYIFSNSFPFSRGYNDVNFPRMYRVGVNYHLPLFYPDWGFANMLYFRRVRMNAFYDYTEGTSLRTGTSYPFSTAGAEFFFDTKWWNQLPLTIGVRYSRMLDNEFYGNTNPNRWEIILPVNLLPR